MQLFVFASTTANYLKLCNICQRLHLHNPCILEDGKIPLQTAVSSANSMLHGLLKQIQCEFFLLDDNLRENSFFSFKLLVLVSFVRMLVNFPLKHRSGEVSTLFMHQFVCHTRRPFRCSPNWIPRRRKVIR